MKAARYDHTHCDKLHAGDLVAGGGAEVSAAAGKGHWR